MRKIIGVLLFIVIIILVSIFIIEGKKRQPSLPNEPAATSSNNNVSDEALKNALNLYAQKKSAGVDFSNGPCLGLVTADWVVDIAHNPRLPVDDQAENQCPDFREGRAHHFIELDPEGKLIKSY